MNITEDFLNEILGDREGIAYAPTKDIATGHFQQYFFSWPDQKKDVLTHLLQQSRTVDVYISPSLFNKHSSLKADWKGSHYAWIEFDGNAPETTPKGIPEPTIRIQSSEAKHEHWYWKLKNFETNHQVLETLTKQLSYTLEADLSGWDAGQVLRPPGTRHHESGRRTRVIRQNQSEFGYNDFTNLKELPDDLEVDLTKDIPEVRQVISKYRMPGEVYELFNRPEQPKGSRSSAMTRLAFHCVELGMTNEECFSLLLDADDRWGKFKTRPPEQRRQRLVGIIQHVRSKKSTESILQLNDDLVVFTLGDFLTSEEVKIDWVFENLLAEQGLGTIGAMPGVGKSTMSFQMGIKATLAHNFLKWENRKQLKACILSFEMDVPECKPFLGTMLQGYSEAEVAYLRDNMTIVPYGSKFVFNNKENRQKILDVIDAKESNFIVIDSLKQIVSRMRDEELDEVYEFINKDIRKDRKCAVWIIHHLRKPGNEGPRKPQDIADLYGDQYIGANATAVLGLWKRTPRQLEVLNFKTRMAPETEPFLVMRTAHLDFQITEHLDVEGESSQNFPVAKVAKEVKNEPPTAESPGGVPL